MSAEPVNMDHFDYSTPKQKNSWPDRVYKLREERGNKCEHCLVAEEFNKRQGSNLQFAHVQRTGLRGRGRGQTQRFKDIANHPECYKLLCKKCHKEIGDP